jgi:hypothetical protein
MAIDPEGNTIIQSVIGTLPPWISFHTNGASSFVTSTLAYVGTFEFIIRLFDGAEFNDYPFNITDLTPPSKPLINSGPPIYV